MGNREYFPMWHSYYKKCEKFSDSELGRLVRALMKYSITGERSDLNGRESGAFEFMAYDIDEAANNYAETCDKNRENINKRWKKENTTVYDRIPTDTKDTKQKQKQNLKQNLKENNPPVSPLEVEFGEELREAVGDWLRYKQERHESYKPTGHKLLLSQIASKANEYGESAVAEIIHTSISSGYKGIVFDRLAKGNKGQAHTKADNFDPEDPFADWRESG